MEDELEPMPDQVEPCSLTQAQKDEIEAWFAAGIKARDIGLDEAWESFKKLPPLDMIKVWLYLSKNHVEFCEDRLFVRFANLMAELTI